MHFMRRNSLFIFVLLALSCGCSTLKVMTYNVGAFGKYSEDSVPEVAAMIGETGPRAVALNELDSCNTRHDVFQAEYLARCLGGWDYSFGRAMPFAGGAYGNGVVTRDRIIKSFTIALPKEEGSEPRSCAVVETPGYVLASVHLDHISAEARVRQAGIVNERLVSEYGGSSKPVFLCGDFNDTPGSLTLGVFRDGWQLLSDTSYSFSSIDPHVCIDYILVLKNMARVKPLKSEVMHKFESGDVKHASDHLPVYVKVRILSPSSGSAR